MALNNLSFSSDQICVVPCLESFTSTATIGVGADIRIGLSTDDSVNFGSSPCTSTSLPVAIDQGSGEYGVLFSRVYWNPTCFFSSTPTALASFKITADRFSSS